LRRYVEWLEELRQEARELDALPQEGNEEKSKHDHLDDEALLKAAECWDTSVSEELLSVLSDGVRAVRPALTTRFLSSALRGWSMRSVKSSISVPFPRLLAERAGNLGMAAPDVARAIGLEATPSDFSSECFTPWNLSSPQIRELSRMLRWSMSEIRGSIQATDIAPQAAGALARSDSMVSRSEAEEARVASELLASLRRQLRAKESLLEALEKDEGD